MSPRRPLLVRGILGVASLRRAQRGPLRQGWSIETETLSRVLHHYARRSTRLPLSVQRWAIGAMPPPGGSAKITQVSADGVPGAWIVPDGEDTGRVLYYLHGGGYSIGSVASHQPFIARLAQQMGARAFAIDYRLAPEHRFPAQRQDATTAWRWLLRQGIAPAQVLMAGESAGGGLTMSTLCALRDAGEPMPAAAAIISPWVDLTLSGESIDGNARFDFLSRSVLETYVRRLMGDEDPALPAISTVFAPLHDLPPILIQVGEAEALLDDAITLARRLSDAKSPVTLHAYPDMIHAFPLMAQLAEAKAALIELADFGRANVRGR
jgi:acetyl esterase/lipase